MTRLSSMGLEALTLATEFGFPVFPAAPRSKTPLLRPIKHDGTTWDAETDDDAALACAGGFHRATTHPDAIAEYWSQWPEANIAIRLGSHLRLCMVEADTTDAGEHLERLALDWPASPTFRASRGNNRLFVASADLPERPVRNLWPEQFDKGVEFKNGLGYYVAPPSIHPSGYQYAWCDGLSPYDVDLAPLPENVADEVRRLDRLRLEKVERENDDAITALGLHHFPRHADASANAHDRQVLRVQRYLETFPCGLSDGRKTAAYRLAAALVTRLEVDASDVLTIVHAWNACNSPPLSARILRNHVRNACRYAGRSVAA